MITINNRTLVPACIAVPVAALLALTSQAQIVQPSMNVSTWFGGSLEDRGIAVACSGGGQIYLAGRTLSTSDIATPSTHQSSLAGSGDAFLASFNEDGSLEWGTYFGGTLLDRAFAVTVGTDGRVYLAGGTSSTQGIAVPDAHQPVFGGVEDAFLACFEPTGLLVWSTYYGGADLERAWALAVAANGDILLAGGTASTSGIATPGAHQSFSGGSDDAFLVRFSASGQRLWGTYYGGSGFDEGRAVREDSNGDIVLAGITRSNTGIAQNGHQNTIGDTPSGDAFLVKFSASGQLLWGTYFGGPSGDQGLAVDMDADRNILLAGNTNSATGIAFSGHQMTMGQGILGDAFLAKFNPDGTLLWSTYYGGSGQDQGAAVRVAANGDVFLGGQSSSVTGIGTPGPWQQQPEGGVDAFVAAFSAGGTRLWGLFHGGAGGDGGLSMDLALNGSLWLAGNTASATGMATPGAHQSTYGGSNDAFLMQLVEGVTTGIGDLDQTTPWLINDLDQERILFLGQPMREVCLRSANGSLLRCVQRVTEVPLTGLPPGVYIVEALDASGAWRAQRVIR